MFSMPPATTTSEMPSCIRKFLDARRTSLSGLWTAASGSIECREDLEHAITNKPEYRRRSPAVFAVEACELCKASVDVPDVEADEDQRLRGRGSGADGRSSTSQRPATGPAGFRFLNHPMHISGSKLFVSSPWIWPVCEVRAISAERRYGPITVTDDDKMYC
jgi:hypothetical protein